MAHVSEQKKKTVSEFVELLDKYPVIGIVDMGNIPAKQLQNMRSSLRDKNTVLRMTKKRLMKIAFSKSKKENISELEKYFKGMPALIFTEENPFRLYGDLQKTKSKAPAKAGQHAPKDIEVSAGPTSFAPGPIIGQLGKFGIKTGVEGGKLAIKQNAVVAKKGDVISQELAGILIRLGIEPMEIGLDLTAAYENGAIYESDILYIDEKEYFQKFVSAHSESFNLAVYTAYPTQDTIKVLLGKAHNDSKALAVSQNILNEETTADILRKAYSEMLSLSSSLPEEALSDELKQRPPAKAAAPQEEKKETPDDKPEPPKEEPQADAAAGLGSLFG